MKMINTVMTLALMSISIPSLAQSRPKAIYGTLDIEYVTDKSNAKLKELGTGVGYLIPQKKVREASNAQVQIQSYSLRNEFGLCQDEKLANHIGAQSACSGFLVGEDLLVTAGHCVRDMDGCQNLNIIFGVTKDKERYGRLHSEESQRYFCKDIIETSQDEKDYAIIKLDRKVKGRHIFTLGDDSKLNRRSKVYMLGHPFGTSLTHSRPTSVKEFKDPDFFRAPIDSFIGNSGSPVIDTKSHQVMGILAAGQKDFYQGFHCQRLASHDSGGERATRVRLIKDLVENNK